MKNENIIFIFFNVRRTEDKYYSSTAGSDDRLWSSLYKILAKYWLLKLLK